MAWVNVGIIKGDTGNTGATGATGEKSNAIWTTATAPTTPNYTFDTTKLSGLPDLLQRSEILLSIVITDIR